MGQAKQRGSFEQRQAEGIIAAEKRKQERLQVIAKRKQEMDAYDIKYPEKKIKRQNAQMMLATVLGMGMSASIGRKLERK
jgi:hypothetical protein